METRRLERPTPLSANPFGPFRVVQRLSAVFRKVLLRMDFCDVAFQDVPGISGCFQEIGRQLVVKNLTVNRLA